MIERRGILAKRLIYVAYPNADAGLPKTVPHDLNGRQRPLVELERFLLLTQFRMKMGKGDQSQGLTSLVMCGAPELKRLIVIAKGLLCLTPIRVDIAQIQ